MLHVSWPELESKVMSAPELVTLNVGGVIYTTTRGTLTKYQDSMLGAMFRYSHNEDVHAVTCSGTVTC